MPLPPAHLYAADRRKKARQGRGWVRLSECPCRFILRPFCGSWLVFYCGSCFSLQGYRKAVVRVRLAHVVIQLGHHLGRQVDTEDAGHATAHARIENRLGAVCRDHQTVGNVHRLAAEVAAEVGRHARRNIDALNLGEGHPTLVPLAKNDGSPDASELVPASLTNPEPSTFTRPTAAALPSSYPNANFMPSGENTGLRRFFTVAVDD